MSYGLLFDSDLPHATERDGGSPYSDFSGAIPARTLLVDCDAVHREALAERLRHEGLSVEITRSVQQAGMKLRRQSQPYAFVIVDVTDARQPWMSAIRQLVEASRQSNFSHTPLFLCISRVKREPQFELKIERLGARYASEQ